MAEYADQRSGKSYAPEVPTKNLPPVGYKDIPEPEPLRKILGPGVILAGIGVGSGEYILWPYLGESERWTESRIYITVVWGMIVVGILILLFAVDQPTTLVIIASSLSGVVMLVYSVLLIQLNRRALPEAIRVRGYRLGVLVISVLFFGYFSFWYIIDKVPSLLGFG